MTSMTSWLANRARAELCHSSPHPSPGTVRGRVGAPWLTPAHSFLQSYLVQDQVPNFLWTTRLSNIDQQLLMRIEVVNRYPQLYALCTKVGAQRPQGGGHKGWRCPEGNDKLL